MRWLVNCSISTAACRAFFRLLGRDFGPDQKRLRSAWAAYDKAQTPRTLQALLQAVEPPRQEMFRRLNLAPGGTSALVGMRQDLIEHGGKDADLASVEDDLVHLLYSWFNRGFLMMQRITWSSPADILERIIRYEAVHMIQGWDDLRRRLQPSDRRCYAFFHPSLADEPLIFVEVALTKDIPSSIQAVLADDRKVLPAEEASARLSKLGRKAGSEHQCPNQHRKDGESGHAGCPKENKPADALRPSEPAGGHALGHQ